MIGGRQKHYIYTNHNCHADSKCCFRFTAAQKSDRSKPHHACMQPIHQMAKFKKTLATRRYRPGSSYVLALELALICN